MPDYGKDYEDLNISIPRTLTEDLFHVTRQSGHSMTLDYLTANLPR